MSSAFLLPTPWRLDVASAGRRSLPASGRAPFVRLPAHPPAQFDAMFEIPSLHVASSSMTDVVSTPSSFEAIVPDTVVLAGFGTTLVLCCIAAWVWSTQVVPISRTKLALSKRNGPVREYLDDLRASATTTTDTMSTMVNDMDSETDTLPVGDDSGNRALERWIFTDWLQDGPTSGRPGRQKEAALPILKSAKWNSGDNPVLAATALILLGVVFTSVTERIVSLSPLKMM